MYDQFQLSFRFAMFISGAIALVLSLLTGFLPRALIFPINLLLTVAVTVVYGSQMVYHFIFGTPYSVAQMGLGAGAVSQFWRETLTTMTENWPWILALLLPLLLLILFKATVGIERQGWRSRFVILILVAGMIALTWKDICSNGTNMFSDYYFFTSSKSTTAQTLERFGVPMTFLLELTRPEDTSSSMSVVVELPASDTPEEEDVPDATEAPVIYNVFPVDFEALNAETDNQKLITLNNYFAQLPGTKQNAYTGMFRDYNLIYICAESFSPAAVDPEYTPTLYKLTHEGFLFENYYNTFPNTTTDGEYTLTQGLYPDGTKDKYSSSMMASQKNYLPFTLGNAFENEFGVKCWGYHNNVGNYYRRDLTHPNMGYEMQFSRDGMTFSGYWPTSDLEMMEQSVDDYIGQEQFHAYYMTFSGHYKYDTSINTMASRNYKQVIDLDYSAPCRAYLSCNIELDKAWESESCWLRRRCS